MSTNDQTTEQDGHSAERRDFLFIAAGGFGAVALGAAAWPLVDQMNPSADVLALGSIEVDLAAVEEGQEIKVKWRGKPVFIRHRTAADIEAARAGDSEPMPDMQTNEERVQEGREQWLVMLGVCTHLGCIPNKVSTTAATVEPTSGSWNGWYCPCHGSFYDTSGRIRKGPAPNNLEVPDFTFLSDTRIKIG